MTALPVRLAPTAQDHVFAIRIWWRANRSSARDLFDTELSAALHEIAAHPLDAAVHATVDAEQIRRVPLVRSRYAVYYYVRSDALDVVTVWPTAHAQGPALR